MADAAEETTPEVDYKVSENAAKNVAEILAADADDESLRKYKESLLGTAAHGDVGNKDDPRRLIVNEFRVVFDPSENRPDTVFTLDTPEGLANLQTNGISLKEGCKYKFRLSFRVQHEIISGIKFVSKIKKAVFSDKEDIMIGSFAPSSQPHQFDFPKFGYREAPSGMLFRGKYEAKNQFLDSEKVNHLEFGYTVDIKKTWD
jgi:Rho GDP-dissociation inhibitor